MIGIEQIKALQQRVETLGRCINVEDKRADVASRQERTLAADFWDDPKAAEKFLKETIKSLLNLLINKSLILLYQSK